MPSDILPGRLFNPNQQQVYWLLTIWYGAEIIRLSTDYLHIEEASSGKQHTYHGTLPNLMFSEEIDPIQGITEGASVTINDVLLPVPINGMEGLGHRFAGSKAELARWVEGTDLSERKVALLGQVSGPEWGSDYETASFAVESVIWKEDRLVPSEGQRVTGATWDTVLTLDPAELGLYYPMVFGTPGKVSEGLISRGWITGSQGVWVDRTTSGPDGGGLYDDLRIILAGHPVKASRVWMSTDADVAGHRFEVRHVEDNRGQIVAVVDARLEGGGTILSPDADGVDTLALGALAVGPSFQPGQYVSNPQVAPVFCGWLNGAGDAGGGEGGMIGPDGQLVRHAMDVLETMLNHTGKPVDHGRFAARKGLLPNINIDCVIDAQVRPWAWIQEHLLPILPISIATGPDGLFPVVWRYDATRHDAVAQLDAGTDPRIERAGRIRSEDRHITNSFALDYALSLRTGGFYGNARLNAEPYDSDDPDNLTSLHCRLSQNRYRYANDEPRIVERKLESKVVYETASANAILAWMARAYSLERQSVDYVVPEVEFSHLELGSVVTLTDPTVDIKEWVCLVTKIEIDDSNLLGLQLLRIEDPVRDAHNTP